MLKKRRSVKTQNIVKKRKQLFYVKIVGLLTLLLLFVSGLSALSSADFLILEKVVVSGARGADAEGIQKTALSLMQGEYWHLFSRQNTFLYPEEEIKNKILQKYERLEKVSFNRTGLQKLEISVVKRKPKYLWCGQEYTTMEKSDVAISATKSAKQECYFLDKTGFIFAPSPSFSGDVYVRFYGALSLPRVRKAQTATTSQETTSEKFVSLITRKAPKASPIGKKFLKGDELQDVLHIVSALEKSGVHTRVVSYEGSGNMVLSTKFGFQVRFLLSQKPVQVVENLLTALNAQVFQGVAGKEKLKTIKYFDLRYGNRVYYK